MLITLDLFLNVAMGTMLITCIQVIVVTMFVFCIGFSMILSEQIQVLNSTTLANHLLLAQILHSEAKICKNDYTIIILSKSTCK